MECGYSKTAFGGDIGVKCQYSACIVPYFSRECPTNSGNPCVKRVEGISTEIIGEITSQSYSGGVFFRELNSLQIEGEDVIWVAEMVVPSGSNTLTRYDVFHYNEISQQTKKLFSVEGGPNLDFSSVFLDEGKIVYSKFEESVGLWDVYSYDLGSGSEIQLTDVGDDESWYAYGFSDGEVLVREVVSGGSNTYSVMNLNSKAIGYTGVLTSELENKFFDGEEEAWIFEGEVYVRENGVELRLTNHEEGVINTGTPLYFDVYRNPMRRGDFVSWTSGRIAHEPGQEATGHFNPTALFVHNLNTGITIGVVSVVQDPYFLLPQGLPDLVVAGPVIYEDKLLWLEKVVEENRLERNRKYYIMMADMS